MTLMIFKRCLIIIVTLMVFPGQESSAATIHVPADQPTIQAGIDVAQNEDTVLVAEGTYSGTGNINVLIVGKWITLASEKGPQSTIIDCQALGRGLSIGPVPGGTVTIEGFSIINGLNTGAVPAGSGGALHCTHAEVVIRDCILQDNKARSDNCYGGAITAEDNSNLTVLSSILTGNEAYGWSHNGGGGAIACIGSTLTIENCILSENRARGYGSQPDDMYGYGYGGAVYVNNSKADIAGTVIRDNRSSGSAQNYTGDDAGGFGGGVYGLNSSLTLHRCLVRGNEVAAAADYGASAIGAGVYSHWTGTLSLQDCQFLENRYGLFMEVNDSCRGGGVYASGMDCQIDDCLFINNHEDQVVAYSLRMDNCTVAGAEPYNYGGSQSGGIYSHEGVISNCIIWENPSPQLYIRDQATIEYSDIEGGWPGTGNLDINPLFTPGPLGDHYLSQIAAGQYFNSPCVNAGDPASLIPDGTTRTDSVQDEGLLDMGYHYKLPDGLYICSEPWTLTYIVEHGGPPPGDRIIEISPCDGGTLEWQVESDTAWLSLSPLSGVSTGEPDPVTVSVDTTGFTPGEYEAEITILAHDAVNSPRRIPIAVSVGEIVIGHFPSSFHFEEYIDHKPAEDQTLEIWSADLISLNWSVSSDVSWMTLHPASGQSTGEHDSVTVHVDSAGLPTGLHLATITISDPQAINSPQEVDVSFRLLEQIIGHQPDEFIFLCDFGGSTPEIQLLEIWNAGDSGMTWTVDESADWLDLQPNMGMSAGEHDIVLVQVDPGSLRPGVYGTTVTISAEMATNSPQFVPVTLFVEDPFRMPKLVTGPGSGPENPSLIRVFPPVQDGISLCEFNAYSTLGFGANASCADIDSDIYEEIITGPGPGEIFGPHVRGFRLNGSSLPGLSFLAYGTHKFGVNVAGGDLDSDGFDEIITGAGPGEVFGPHVRAFDYDGTQSVSSVPGVNFFAYGTPKWGVNVAAGDIDGDGYEEIITGPGPGAVYGPHVRGWDVDGGTAMAIPTVSFFAYGTLKYGVNVTAGDVDGDGIDEIVTGAGPGAIFGPHVRGWNFDGTSAAPLPGCSFFAWQTPPLQYGVNVSSGTDLNDNGRDEIVAGRGPHPDADTEVKVFTYDGSAVSQWISLEAYPEYSYGTNVTAGRF